MISVDKSIKKIYDFLFFFFQAEDGIRDLYVTGVQTCALPILSAYGRDGSRASWPGYDYLMQAEAGYLSLTGEPDGPPSRMGLSIVDLMTGLNAAFAMVSGVLSARATGKGRDIDVNLFDTALQNLCYLAVWHLNAGVNQGREPRSAHPSLVPSQLYRTKDGFIFIMCNQEKFWPVLCDCVGRP